jgi:hypothetical protein
MHERLSERKDRTNSLDGGLLWFLARAVLYYMQFCKSQIKKRKKEHNDWLERILADHIDGCLLFLI